ncbi:MAG TPA: Wzz/FepE/Etk N-terminal domain-containing protein [Stellaceae bacterium]|nr:Wzz/FepE/Etk N-terminal domain-containing protein [Stellaceae bacterium]
MPTNPYDLTTRELLSIAFKEKWKLLGVFFGLFLGAVALSFALTPYYEATSRLLVKSGPEFQVRSEPGQSVASVPYATKQEVVNSELQILTSRDLIESVIKTVGLANLYPDLSGSGSEQHQMDAATRRFLSSFSARPVEQADVISVSYRNPDRNMAVKALAAAIALYQRKHAESFSDEGYRFLEQQTKEYEQKLDAVLKKLADVRNSEMLFDVPAQRAKLIDDRGALSNILQQLRSQSIDAHRRAAFLKDRLKATPAVISAGGSTSEAVEQAKDRLLDLQMREAQLRERYVTEVKPLRDIRQEISVLRQFIASAPGGRRETTQRNPAYDDMVVALNRALADAAPIDQQISLREQQVADIDARLRKLEDGARLVDDLERERRQLDELVHTYRTRYEEARIAQDQKTVSVSVIEQADAPVRAAGPSHFLFAVAGLALGTIGVLAVLAYLLVFRQTIITVESVERLLQIPVLSSVPVR